MKVTEPLDYQQLEIESLSFYFSNIVRSKYIFND